MMLLSCAAWAQASGNISGTVRTQSGEALSNATVTLESTPSGVRQTAVTDSEGHYRFENLAGGTYRLGVNTKGYSGTRSDDMVLDPNRPKTVDISVQNTPNTPVSALHVEEATTGLDMMTPQIGAVFNTQDLRYLPQANLLAPDGSAFGGFNLSYLTAGISSGGGFTNAKGPIVGGQRPISNNFYVDGADDNNRVNPGPLVYVPSEAIAEVAAFQNQFPPEWGHASGGQFNAILKTGTNQLHGAIYEYLQNRNLNAIDQSYANQGVRDLPRYDQNRLGGNLGFAAIPNHLFLFGAFEYIPLGYNGLPGGPVYAPTAAGYAALSGMPGVSATNLNVLQTYAGMAQTQSGFTTVEGVQIPIGALSVAGHQYQNRYVGVGNMDWNISGSDQLRTRYVHNETHANNDGALLPSFYAPLSDSALLASVSEYHNFSPFAVNELRLGFTRFHQTIQTNALTYPGWNVFPSIGIATDLNLTLGPASNAAGPATLNNYQIADNFTWQRGRHTIKFGADARWYNGPLNFSQFGTGVYTYSSLQGFLLDQSPDVTALRSFQNLNYSGNHYDTYGYVNDSWRISSNFNVNLDLKYAYVSIPKTLQSQGLNSIASVPGLIGFRDPNTQKKAFAPLVGVAWSPGLIKNSVLRAGFGMNYDTTYSAQNVPLVAPGYLTTTYLNRSVNSPSFFGSGAIPTPANLFNPSVTAAQAQAATTSYVPDQRLPYTMQWNASWQQQIVPGTVFEARYLGVKAEHLPVSTVLNGTSAVSATENLPTFTTAPSQVFLNSLSTTLGSLQTAARANNPYYAAGFTSPISAIQPWGYSWYNGLALQATQRFSGGLQGIISYTWSHLIDNLSGPNFGVNGFSYVDQQVQKGTSLFDHRQRVAATMLWDVGGIGGGGFHWVRDVLANVTIGGTYTYETPSNLPILSIANTNLTGSGIGGVSVNPNGIAGTGSGVTALTNNAGQIVGYLASNPNAQYIAGGAGTYNTPGRYTFGLRPINNFDATAYKRFAIRDKFSIEVHGDAYNVVNHPQFVASEINNVGTRPAGSNFLVPGTTGFANPAAALPSNARTLQVGLRILF